jgi:uncharacterized protein (DUF58 family)
LCLVLFWYGATSEVPWLFLLAWWVLALVAAAAGYAAWNRSGLSLQLAVRNTVIGAGSPAEQLPEQVLQRGPIPAPVFEGDGFGLEIAIQASRGARGPVWALGLVGDRSISAGTGLVPKGGWSRVEALPALRRGPVAARGWRIHTSDPLGFFRGLRPTPDSEIALILPRFASLAGRREPRELEASLPVPRAGSGNELFGIREYRPGDSLRRIHWRSSARHGELVVREYEPPGVQSLAICLDPQPPTPEVADQIARIAASEAWDCIQEGGQVVVWAPGLEPSQSPRDLWSQLEWLARYPNNPSGGVPRSGRQEVVVITASADEDLLANASRGWVVGDVEIDTDVPFERVGLQWPL